MATPGAQLSQPPVALINTMNGVTQKWFQPILADSAFKPSPTFWRLTRLGTKVEGGGAIVWTAITAEDTAGGAFTGAQLLDTSLSDNGQPAELQWRFYNQPIVITVTDLLMNAGRGQVISLVKAKEEMAMGSMLQKISRAVYATSPQNTALDLDGVPTALASSGTYATVPLSGQWLCNGGNGPTSGGAVGMSNMQSDYGQATYGNEEPDTIVTTQSGWNAFWFLLQPLQRYQRDDDTTRAGFKNHLMFNNAVMLHDQFTTAGEMEMFTSKYVKTVMHSMWNFHIDDFVKPSDQQIIVSYVLVAMNLQFITLRQHSRRTGITNA